MLLSPIDKQFGLPHHHLSVRKIDNGIGIDFGKEVDAFFLSGERIDVHTLVLQGVYYPIEVFFISAKRLV